MPNQITCPHCHAHLKAQESIPPGKLIRCLKCRGRFSVRQPDPDTLISIPYHAPPRSPVFFAVLGLVALLVIGSGTALVMYCFSLPGDSPQLSQGKPADEDPDMPAEDEAENATDSGNANAPKPSEVKNTRRPRTTPSRTRRGSKRQRGSRLPW